MTRTSFPARHQTVKETEHTYTVWRRDSFFSRLRISSAPDSESATLLRPHACLRPLLPRMMRGCLEEILSCR